MVWSKRLSRLETNQQEMRRQLDTIVTALIVSEPRTGLAAEAFDGLRRNVAFAAQERRRQLSQLVAFADAIERGATIDTLRERCEQWCAEAGLRRYADPAAQPTWFEVVEGEGPGLELVEPAWIDETNQVLLRQGTARRVPALEPRQVAGPETEAEPETETEATAATETEAHAEPVHADGAGRPEPTP